MIKVNKFPVKIEHFPDNTQRITLEGVGIFPRGWRPLEVDIEWFYENDEELATLLFVSSALGNIRKNLYLPYVPNARMDRVKKDTDIFTLKHFASFINSLGFDKVTILDPHSDVAPALINNVVVSFPQRLITWALDTIGTEGTILFFPDQGAAKRYGSMIKLESLYGIKTRNWETGKIEDLKLSGDVDVKDKKVLIVDDICSYGGTFLRSAKLLKDHGAAKVYLYVSHCESSILKGDLLKGDLIETVFTTDSIFHEKHEKVEVYKL